MKILFISSEAQPLVKTGGLADVSGALPPVLAEEGADIRLLLPAYRRVKSRLADAYPVARITLPGHTSPVCLLEARMPDSELPIYLVDAPELFERDGGPYVDADGHDWHDNAERFALFSRVAVGLAMGRFGLDWCPDLVHCNDWQTGLVPALLSQEKRHPPTLFTIHNLSYQGRFPGDTFGRLKLPPKLWSMDGLEFYGDLLYIKGGLAYADAITTVSPTYAEEIQHPHRGHGLDGLLRHRKKALHGILNGVDYTIWDPRHDPFIAHHYHAERMTGKAKNKALLQKELSLPLRSDIPLLGLVSRLVEQKGLDLLLEVLPPLLEEGKVQLALLGSGDTKLERAIEVMRNRFSEGAAALIGYDEVLAHRIEAGADIFLMPSRFEPCGLNQLYSLRYGTVPVVHRTGGLADTVSDYNDADLASGKATGFVFEHPDAQGLRWALERALALYQRPRKWRKLQKNGMACDFSWQASAHNYLALYRQLLKRRR